MSGKTIRSSKLKKKRRKVFFLKMALLFLIVFGCVGGLIFGLHTNRLEIHDTNVVGAQESLNSSVERYVEGMLAGSYFGILPKENIFLYPKNNIEKEVLREFPRIQKISLELDPFKEQVLHIDLSERREVGVWCRTAFEEDECYFLDKEGYIFAPAPVYSDGVVFVYQGGIEAENPLGEYFIDTESFTKFNTFVRAIQNSPELATLDPVGLEKMPGGEYKLHLNSGAYVLLDDAYGLAYAYDNLKVVLREEDIDASAIEYVDIRIPDKVFYKQLDS